MLSSFVCSFLLLSSLFMSPCGISCYILTTLGSHTTSPVDSGSSRSTSFGTYGASYGELRCSLQKPLEPVLTHCLSYLLVSRPSRSRALECFVMDISRKSTHIAMLVCSPIVLIAAYLFTSLDTMVHASIVEGLFKCQSYPRIILNLPTDVAHVP